MRLAGNDVLITGGATGIGLAMARAFLARGSRVAVCGRREDKLAQAAAANPGLRAYPCDVGQADQRRSLFDALARDGMAVNVLVNNAACMRRYDLARAESLDMDGVRNDIHTNFIAPVELINLFLPSLRELPGATIVNVCTPGAAVPVVQVPIYCASKAALHSYTLSLRVQLAGKVAVVEIYPPTVETEMVAGVNLKKIPAHTFTDELMPRLEKGEQEIWVGEGRYIPILNRLAPKKTFALVNRATTFD